MEPDRDALKPPGQPRTHPQVPAGQSWQDPRETDQVVLRSLQTGKLRLGEKTCPSSQDVSGRAGLESRPPASQLSGQYLLLPTKEECRGTPGYVWATIPQKHPMAYTH